VEQPLLPYESCNLGSINLVKMLKNVNGKYEIDYDLLERTIYDSVHFLDNVIDVNKYPLPEIDKMTKSTRKIGLGVMGFADMLIMLNIPYNSDEAVELADNLMAFINTKSKEASRSLAKVRGAFPEFENSIYKNGEPIRNATTTTIAPTGTISILAGVSSGMEPLFAVAFVRNVMDNDKLVEVHPYFEKVMKERGLYSKEFMLKVAKQGTLAHIDEIPYDIKRVFVTAHDVNPIWHIKMQAAFQRHTDNAVSKTVNFRNEATVEEVREVYELAYRLGCKGVTIYRDGSREGQVLSVGTDVKSTASEEKAAPRHRPELTRGITEKVRVGCGNLYITVNYDDNGICEVFTNVGKAGGCPSQSEATARLISIGLRSGVDVSSIIEQLRGIRCHSTLRQRTYNKDIKVLSCPDAIARTIEKLLNMKAAESPEASMGMEVEMTIEDLIPVPKSAKKKTTCPECGNVITHQDGCVICPNCGFSKCG
jgi:ribonucleoside-diphosphate reductase alpha chain